VNRRPYCASFIADILFGPPAALASECDEVRFVFPDLMPSQHHERAAVQVRRILSGVQRIEQEFLVAGHSVLSPRPNFQPERWLLGDPPRPPRRRKNPPGENRMARCALREDPEHPRWIEVGLKDFKGESHALKDGARSGDRYSQNRAAAASGDGMFRTSQRDRSLAARMERARQSGYADGSREARVMLIALGSSLSEAKLSVGSIPRSRKVAQIS
jgi:hypothetical protein